MTVVSQGKPTILVVNDQREQLRVICQILKMSGYTVLAFEDPVCALETLADVGSVDLIITDLNMPRINGWELCHRLRSPDMGQHNATPILIISATFAGLQSEAIRLELGVNDFLPVPYQPEQLRRKVSDILQGLTPKPSLRALFIGYADQDDEVTCFRRFGYQVSTALDLESSLEAVGSSSFEILVYRGELDHQEANLLFSPDNETICSIWVLHGSDPDLNFALSELGVHCLLPGCRGEHLIQICENARQHSCLERVRDLLEERTQQLLASEQKYYTLFQSIPNLVLCMSQSGQVLDINETGCTMLGMARDKVVGSNFSDLVSESSQVPFQLALHETILYGSIQYEIHFQGHLQELAAEVHQRRVTLDGETRILAVAHDVTERRQCQEAVLASDTRYRIIAENTYDWEFWLSPQGFFLFSSPSAEKLTGYTSHEFEDEPGLLQRLVLPEDLEKFESEWRMEGPEDLPKDFEFRVLRRDGSVRWLSHVSVAVFDSHGNFLGSRGSHRDVTEKRIIDEERLKLVAAIEQVSEAIMITDETGQIHYVNQAFKDRFERNGLGQSTAGLVEDPSWQATHQEILGCLAKGEGWSGHYTRGRYEIEATVNPVRDSKGRITSFVWVERDVTQERHLSEQLRQSQKMEAIGTLAGGIAHDFNNLLSGILGYSGLLKLHAEGQPQVLQSAEIIERTALRAAELTQKLLGFARRGKHKNVAVNIHRAIDDCIELLSRTIDKRIEIVRRFEASHDKVMGDPTQMEQILLNLAINARDAIEDQGRITFSTSIEEVRGEEAEPGIYLVASVGDSGCGIPPEIRSRVFEPFFTTKENGKGTGMGLAMVYGIVKNHGGTIRLESEPGKGTTFHCYLPLTDQSVREEVVKATPMVRGSGKILVVDDEELLRDVACKLLKHLGYQVVTASDGLQACEYYEEHQRDVDLVIVDMIMPKVGGAECFRNLKRINPEVRAVLSTGYSLNDTAQQLLDEGMVGFIQKPYQLSQLSEVMAKALVPA
jgi:two-component system cell cycle sensor histidine kinase/response regulator CckA